jgi:hypothetical protein
MVVKGYKNKGLKLSLKYLIFCKLIQAGIPNLKLLDNKLNWLYLSKHFTQFLQISSHISNCNNINDMHNYLNYEYSIYPWAYNSSKIYTIQYFW